MTKCSNMQNITIPRHPKPIHDVLLVIAGLAYVPSVMPARLSPTTSRQHNFGLRGDKPRVYVTKRTHKEGGKPNDLLSYLTTAEKNCIQQQRRESCRSWPSCAVCNIPAPESAELSARKGDEPGARSRMTNGKVAKLLGSRQLKVNVSEWSSDALSTRIPRRWGRPLGCRCHLQ